MAAPATIVMQRVRGKLVANPTSLAGAYPYGGTELGAVRDMEFRVGVFSVPVRGSEFGVTIDRLRTGEFGVFAAFMRGWDIGMISTIFPNVTNSGSGFKFDADDATYRAGMWESSRAISLLFVPQNPTVQRAIYLRTALPMPSESAAMQLSPDNEVGLPVMFESIPSDNGLSHHVALLANITL